MKSAVTRPRFFVFSSSSLKKKVPLGCSSNEILYSPLTVTSLTVSTTVSLGPSFVILHKLRIISSVLVVVLKNWHGNNYYIDNNYCKSLTLRRTPYYEDLRHLLHIDLFAGQFHRLSNHFSRNVPHTVMCIHFGFPENSTVEYSILALKSQNFPCVVLLHRFPYINGKLYQHLSCFCRSSLMYIVQHAINTHLTPCPLDFSFTQYRGASESKLDTNFQSRSAGIGSNSIGVSRGAVVSSSTIYKIKISEAV